MTTGARRGELCALRWSNVDLESGTLTIRRAIAQDGRALQEKDTKTHQQRRLALDAETVEVLRDHRERCEERARALGVELRPEAFVFSLAPDGSASLVPGSVTPLALVNDAAQQAVRFVLDERLMDFDTINCHPLRNDQTTCLAPQDLLKFIKDLGYAAQITGLAAEAATAEG